MRRMTWMRRVAWSVPFMMLVCAVVDLKRNTAAEGEVAVAEAGGNGPVLVCGQCG